MDIFLLPSVKSIVAWLAMLRPLAAAVNAGDPMSMTDFASEFSTAPGCTHKQSEALANDGDAHLVDAGDVLFESLGHRPRSFAHSRVATTRIKPREFRFHRVVVHSGRELNVTLVEIVLKI